MTIILSTLNRFKKFFTGKLFEKFVVERIKKIPLQCTLHMLLRYLVKERWDFSIRLTANLPRNLLVIFF